VIGTGAPHLGKGGHGRFVREVAAVIVRTAGIRRAGAAALDLAWVAAGRLDAFWERDISSWDVAAGDIIIREAGGFVTNAEGTGDAISSDTVKVASLCCGNETIHRELVALLKGAA
jgi:myo-inositol-1(or 4)-monophosphatase